MDTSDRMRAPGSARHIPHAPQDHFNDFQAYITDRRCMPSSPRAASQLRRALEVLRAIKGVHDRKQLLSALLVALAIDAHYAGYSLRDIALNAIELLIWSGVRPDLARESILAAISRSGDVDDSQVRTYVGPGIAYEAHADQIHSSVEATHERHDESR